MAAKNDDGETSSLSIGSVQVSDAGASGNTTIVCVEATPKASEATPDAEPPKNVTPKGRDPTDVPDEVLLHGAPLYFMISGTTLACLLVALNGTILGTVSRSHIFWKP